MATRAAAIAAALAKPNTLAYCAAQAGILYGDVAGRTYFTTQTAEAALAAKECSTICNTLSSPGVWRNSTQGGTADFSASDALVAWCNANNLAVWGGYTIVHENQPAWITTSSTPSQAIAEIQSEVNAIMGHYAPGGANPNPFDYWVVVNEAIDPTNATFPHYRSCTWNTAVGGSLPAGTDYISQAFAAARVVDPTATLVYGDEICNGPDGPNAYLYYSYTLNLLTYLKTAGIVDGLMIQCHRMGRSSLDVAALKSFLDSVYALGLKIYIGELDVSDQYLPADILSRDAMVAKMMQILVTAVINHPGVQSITTWGICDSFSWLQYANPRSDALPSRPGIYDLNYARKLSYYALRAAFNYGAANTNGTLPHGGFILSSMQ